MKLGTWHKPLTEEQALREGARLAWERLRGYCDYLRITDPLDTPKLDCAQRNGEACSFEDCPLMAPLLEPKL